MSKYSIQHSKLRHPLLLQKDCHGKKHKLISILCTYTMLTCPCPFLLHEAELVSPRKLWWPSSPGNIDQQPKERLPSTRAGSPQAAASRIHKILPTRWEIGQNNRGPEHINSTTPTARTTMLKNSALEVRRFATRRYTYTVPPTN